MGLVDLLVVTTRHISQVSGPSATGGRVSGGRTHPLARDFRAVAAVLGAACASVSAVTSTSTVMPRWSEGKPVQVPEIGTAWRGSRATATRIRSRLPTMPLVGSYSTQPA